MGAASDAARTGAALDIELTGAARGDALASRCRFRVMHTWAPARSQDLFGRARPTPPNNGRGSLGDWRSEREHSPIGRKVATIPGWSATAICRAGRGLLGFVAADRLGRGARYGEHGFAIPIHRVYAESVASPVVLAAGSIKTTQLGKPGTRRDRYELAMSTRNPSHSSACSARPMALRRALLYQYCRRAHHLAGVRNSALLASCRGYLCARAMYLYLTLLVRALGAASIVSACASAGAPPGGVPKRADPLEDPTTLVRYGREALGAGDSVRAEQYLVLAMNQGAGREQVMPLLIRACIQGGRLRAALDYAEMHLGEHPRDVHLRFLAATIHAGLGQDGVAIGELERIVDDDAGTDDAESHFLLGSLLAQRDTRRARRHFSAYLAHEPEGVHASAALAWLDWDSRSGNLGGRIADSGAVRNGEDSHRDASASAEAAPRTPETRTPSEDTLP